MIKLLMILICGVLLTACATLEKNGTKKSERSYQSTESSRKVETNAKKENQVLIIRDSLEETIVTEILPNGIFSYSPHDGFKGTATHLKIKGKRGTARTTLKENQSTMLNEQVQNRTAQQSEKEATRKRESSSFSVDFYFYTALVILIGLLWIWWKR